MGMHQNRNSGYVWIVGLRTLVLSLYYCIFLDFLKISLSHTLSLYTYIYIYTYIVCII